MDLQRTLLFLALGFVSLMIWQAWELEHQPKQAITTEQINAPISKSIPAPTIPENTASAAIPVPSSPVAIEKPMEVLQGDIQIKTDVFDIEMNSKGGKIVQLQLSKYPIDIEHKNTPFSLLQAREQPFYFAENGVKGVGGLDVALFPDHHATFKSSEKSYTMTENVLRVPLVWQHAGIEITKTYVFSKGSYVIEVEYQVKNQSQAAWKGSVYGQLQREGLLESEERSLTSYSYTGGAYYDKEDGFQKVSFDDLADKNLNKKTTDGWIGFIQHYFSGAVISKEAGSRLYSYRPTGNNYVVGALTPVLSVAPNETKTTSFSMFLGPKLQDQMEKAAPGLELTVDYGWLTFIAKPIFWLLKFIQSFVQNWGVAIILVTAVIKLIFYKLSETSYKSMAKMRKLQPRLAKLKERFGDDKQKMNQAMMKMYQEEKVNPMSGCLPVVVQIPVFIALYWVLLESVELRQASFLWLKDLSIPDPYFILPVIMGVSMFIQQKLNPKPTDPMQAKVMMFLPIIFTVFFAFFPSGLVLYWVANNIFSITQQWVITKRING